MKTLKDWEIIETGLDGNFYTSKRFRLNVCVSKSKEMDNKFWAHVSLTRYDKKLPTYEQLKLVKDIFIGEDRNAIQVFSKKKNHVNIHPTCLHLWSCEDDPIPDFSRGTGSI